MKLIFIEKDKSETEFKIGVGTDTEEQINMIKERFDNREVQKYEIEFLEGVQVKDIDNLEDIKPSMIATLVLRLRGSIHYVCNADCPDVEYGNCCHPNHCQKKLVSK